MELELAAEAQAEKQYVQQDYCSDEYSCKDRGYSLVNELVNLIGTLTKQRTKDLKLDLAI